MWFADPKDDDFCLGPNSPVTPFDGDNEAGVQAFNSAKADPLPAPRERGRKAYHPPRNCLPQAWRSSLRRVGHGGAPAAYPCGVGVSPVSPLARKLLIKSGQRGALCNAPAGYEHVLDPLPEGASLAAESGSDLDFVLVFARNAGELEAYAPQASNALKPSGLFWVAYPKGGKKAGTDLNRDLLWDLMGRHGWVGVTLVAVDATWSAFRFRPSGDAA